MSASDAVSDRLPCGMCDLGMTDVAVRARRAGTDLYHFAGIKVVDGGWPEAVALGNRSYRQLFDSHAGTLGAVGAKTSALRKLAAPEADLPDPRSPQREDATTGAR